MFWPPELALVVFSFQEPLNKEGRPTCSNSCSLLASPDRGESGRKEDCRREAEAIRSAEESRQLKRRADQPQDTGRSSIALCNSQTEIRPLETQLAAASDAASDSILQPPSLLASRMSGPQSLRGPTTASSANQLAQDRKLHQLSVPVRNSLQEATDAFASGGATGTSSWDDSEVARQIALLTEERNFLRKYGQEELDRATCDGSSGLTRPSANPPG